MAGNALVLIADPDPDMRRILSAFLAHAGHRVLQAADAGSAMDIVSRRRPTLIVGEHPLSTADGSTLCDLLQRDPSTARIPFIALTVNVLPDQVDEACRSHHLVFTKPPDFGDLVDAVQATVDRVFQRDWRAGSAPVDFEA